MGKRIFAVVLVAGVFAGLGYWLGTERKPPEAPAQAAAETRKPQHKAADAGIVSISPHMVQNLGVRTARARSGSIEQRFQATGAVAYDERAVVLVQARVTGFVERVRALAPLDPVARGAPLVDIMFPEWTAAEEEYLLAHRADTEELRLLARAARQRLRLLGMTESQIASLEREGVARTRFTLTSPISGVIAELGVREGATVSAGQTLYRIVDLSTVWVNAELPEAQSSWVTAGAHVEARVPAHPDSVFMGRVELLLPEVNAATRTVRARIELDNRGGHLMPGMFATLTLRRGAPRRYVLVPSEAVIRTGARNVVIVALDEGRYRPSEVELGFEAGGEAEIRKGLKAGEKVVLSGQFLIDSEASLSAAVSRLEEKGDAQFELLGQPNK